RSSDLALADYLSSVEFYGQARRIHSIQCRDTLMDKDYQRIEKAIAYLVAHAAEQPTLAQVAAHVHLSPFHFQRLFCQWAGTTPKRFLQVLTVARSKHLLEQSQSLMDVSHSVGLSGSSRLHDHFVQLEPVSPGEYKNKGINI